MRWIKRQLGPVGITVDTAEALTEHEKQGHVLLIGYFAALDDSNTAYKKFKEAAVDVDMPVLQTTSADVAKAAGGLSVDSLVLIKNPEVRRGHERAVTPLCALCTLRAASAL